MNRQLVAKAAFAILATPAVWRAAWRARRLVRSLPLDEATLRLAGAPRWRWDALDQPAWLAGTVDRWLPWLPPRGYGACLRRSLALLDLWGRCGIEPRLHLGMAQDPQGRAFHAWVEARGISAGAGARWDAIWDGGAEAVARATIDSTTG